MLSPVIMPSTDVNTDDGSILSATGLTKVFALGRQRVPRCR